LRAAPPFAPHRASRCRSALRHIALYCTRYAASAAAATAIVPPRRRALPPRLPSLYASAPAVKGERQA